MARLEQMIDEIRGLKNETNHRASLRILSLMQNNKKLFLEEIDSDYLEIAIGNFEGLCDTPSKEYSSSAYLRDYEKYYESLMFHLNKVF